MVNKLSIGKPTEKDLLRGETKLFIIKYFIEKQKPCGLHEVFSEINKKVNLNKRGVRKHFRELKLAGLLKFNSETAKYILPENWKTFEYLKKVYDGIPTAKATVVWKRFILKVIDYYSKKTLSEFIELIEFAAVNAAIGNSRGETRVMQQKTQKIEERLRLIAAETDPGKVKKELKYLQGELKQNISSLDKMKLRKIDVIERKLSELLFAFMFSAYDSTIYGREHFENGVNRFKKIYKSVLSCTGSKTLTKRQKIILKFVINFINAESSFITNSALRKAISDAKIESMRAGVSATTLI